MAAPIDDVTKELFVHIAENPDNADWTVLEIREEAKRLLLARNLNARIPSKPWAYDFLRGIRNLKKNLGVMDEPWSVGSSDLTGLDFSGETIRVLIDISRRSLIVGVPFTNRQAKWVGRLRKAFTQDWERQLDPPFENNERDDWPELYERTTSRLRQGFLDTQVEEWIPFIDEWVDKFISKYGSKKTVDWSRNVSFLYTLGTLYANEERAASFLGRPLNTSNLDMVLSIGFLPGEQLQGRLDARMDPQATFIGLANELHLTEHLQSQAHALQRKGEADQLSEWFMSSRKVELVMDSMGDPFGLKGALVVAPPLAADLTLLAVLYVHSRSKVWEESSDQTRLEWAEDLLRTAISEEWDDFNEKLAEMLNLTPIINKD